MAGKAGKKRRTPSARMTSPHRRPRALLAALALLGGTALLAPPALSGPSGSPAAPLALLARPALAAPLSAELMADAPSGLEFFPAPRALPAIAFTDGAGTPLSLADFRGKIVVLNFWATWCGPCRREMPSLDLLQRRFGGDTLEVVALSVDTGGASDIERFYAEHEITSLAIYSDPSWAGLRALSNGSSALPYTLLISADGEGLAELYGPATWHGPSVERFITGLLARTEAQLSPPQVPPQPSLHPSQPQLSLPPSLSPPLLLAADGRAGVAPLPPDYIPLPEVEPAEGEEAAPELLPDPARSKDPIQLIPPPELTPEPGQCPYHGNFPLVV